MRDTIPIRLCRWSARAGLAKSSKPRSKHCEQNKAKLWEKIEKREKNVKKRNYWPRNFPRHIHNFLINEKNSNKLRFR